jgi:ribosome-associated protein
LNQRKNITQEEIIRDALELADLLDNKKAKDISVLDVSGQTPIADVFVIVSAESFIHSKALEDYSEDFLDMRGYKRLNGSNVFPENPWILLDYGEIIVHVFLDKARDYYQLEKLWYDAKQLYQGGES